MFSGQTVYIIGRLTGRTRCHSDIVPSGKLRNSEAKVSASCALPSRDIDHGCSLKELALRQHLRMIIRNQVYLLHDFFDLRSHGRTEFFLRFRRQMKPVGAIGRDDGACVKEGCAPKVRNALVEL